MNIIVVRLGLPAANKVTVWMFASVEGQELAPVQADTLSLQSRVENTIALANEALENSGVDLQLDLVYSTSVSGIPE